jgi:tripartite-type tricarboxylate transporter receptor subunit TctC
VRWDVSRHGGRWTAAIAIAVASFGFAAAPAGAQSYPTRAVEIIVPFAAGGGNDVLARIMGEGLAKRLGQSFVPLNRPGANTNNGTLQVVKSPPDGYTLLISSVWWCRPRCRSTPSASSWPI